MNSIDNINKIMDLLADPTNYQNKIDISGYSENLIKDSLYSMTLIRRVEEKLAKEKEQGMIIGPVHLGAGQEAIAVGISANLTNNDRVFGAHRSHSHILALEASVYELFAEVLGKNTGLSKGMGGSMHLTNINSGFIGSVPIVSGTVPLAVGASFDAKFRGTNDIGVAYIGDGAMEEGIVHESLNLAKILNTPTLFVVENNLFSSHMHISLRQPSSGTSRFALANDIEFSIIDGNDCLEVFNKSKYLIDKIRNGEGPKFLEAVTYRHYGHVDWRKDVDVGVNRSEKDLSNWMKRDPISRLVVSVLDNNLLNEEDISKMESSIENLINVSWKKAQNDEYPKVEALLTRVYSDEE
jgi:pyruvate dehydrogenase E1 component alpha subunit|tara:strand:- start:4712 stop:5770 length:1059 start_codon:yes stop_codon:yes gene_type:complete